MKKNFKDILTELMDNNNNNNNNKRRVELLANLTIHGDSSRSKGESLTDCKKN